MGAGGYEFEISRGKQSIQTDNNYKLKPTLRAYHPQDKRESQSHHYTNKNIKGHKWVDVRAEAIAVLKTIVIVIGNTGKNDIQSNEYFRASSERF